MEEKRFDRRIANEVDAFGQPLDHENKQVRKAEELRTTR
jgi:hypothetical protein